MHAYVQSGKDVMLLTRASANLLLVWQACVRRRKSPTPPPLHKFQLLPYLELWHVESPA